MIKIPVSNKFQLFLALLFLFSILVAVSAAASTLPGG